MAFLFGVSGFLLNHHAKLKLPLAKLDRTEIELTLTAYPENAEALAKWLQAELKIESEPDRINKEKEKKVAWGDRQVRQPEQWKIDFHTPGYSVNADYWVGNTFVTVKRQEANFFALISRIHKGTGLGAVWIILADTLAIAMVILSLSGLFMWTKLHGPTMTFAVLGLLPLTIAVLVLGDAVF